VNHFAFHLGDYAVATDHLTFVEDAAYFRLLRRYYSTEKPLPCDVKQVQRLVRAATDDERSAVETVLKEFFVRQDDGWHNKRADEEIAIYQAKAEHNRRVGLRGGRPPKNPDETQPVSDAKPGNNPAGFESEPTGNPNHKPVANSQEKTSKPNGLDVPGKPDPCPHQKIIALFHEVLPSHPKVKRWTPARAGKLRARWQEEAMAKSWSSEADGLAFFRKYFAYVSESAFLTGQTPGRGGRAPFIASLEFLVTQEKFVKVIEGEYHRS
jgi:uncharacterized protein YdaU (DUF1376 family)